MNLEKDALQRALLSERVRNGDLVHRVGELTRALETVASCPNCLGCRDLAATVVELDERTAGTRVANMVGLLRRAFELHEASIEGELKALQRDIAGTMGWSR